MIYKGVWTNILQSIELGDIVVKYSTNACDVPGGFRIANIEWNYSLINKGTKTNRPIQLL